MSDGYNLFIGFSDDRYVVLQTYPDVLDSANEQQFMSMFVNAGFKVTRMRDVPLLTAVAVRSVVCMMDNSTVISMPGASFTNLVKNQLTAALQR